MSTNLKILIFLTLWIIALPLRSINPNGDIKVFLMKDGLQSDYVNCVAQDKFNKIWIGTEFGLNRFDGIQMSSYTFDPQNAHSISNNFIHDIYTDKKNDAIWIATDAGINKYEYKSGKFIRYFNKKNQSYNDIIKIFPKDINTLWLASYRGGLLTFDIKKGNIHWINDVYNHCNHPDGSMKVNTIIQDNENNVWIGTLGNGLYKYNIRNSEISQYLNVEKNALNIESFYIDPKNTLWIGTNRGIIKYNKNTDNFSTDSRLSFLNSRIIKSIVPSKSNKELNICTDNGIFNLSISQLQNSNTIQYQYIAENPQSKGLSNSFITNVLEDNSQNLWIATASGGLNLLLNRPSKFGVIYETNNKSAIERKLLPIAEDTKGRIWFGANIEQLNISDTTQNRFNKLPIISELRKLGISDIQTLCFSKSNVLWLGTQHKGLASYDMTTHQTFIYNTLNSNLPDNDIRIVKEDSKGNIWVGTNKGGLCSFYQKSQSFEIYNPTDKDLNFSRIRQIEEDNAGNWWVGTEDNGIKMLNPISGKIASFESGKKGNYYIPDNYISSICIDKKNQVWIGTRNSGLLYYNKTNNIFKSIPTTAGIPQAISHIEPDDNGNLWISSVNSICRFDLNTYNSVVYGQKDGVNSGLFLINSGIKTTKGRILFAATRGIIAFNPKKFFSSSEAAFPTIITAIQISNHSKEETENLWIKNLEQKKSLSLNYNQSSFSIYFVSPNFEHANETKYAYYLEGEEKTWNYMGNNNFASYRNLKPGKYTFRVKASNANNIWCKSVTELEIIITPPFWETWPMKLLYFLIFGLLIWGGWNYALARFRRINNRKLEEIERLKNIEINDAKLQFFTNISHEFRTPMTLILSPLSKLFEKETDPEKLYLLEVMRKNSNRLLRLVNEVLDFRKLDKESIQLHYEQTNVTEFITELINSFEVYCKEKKIDLVFLHPGDDVIVSIDKDVVEKIIINLLSNAIKFSFERSEVILSLKNNVTNEQLIIEIKDSGIGLSPENKARVFDQFYQVKTDSQYSNPGSGIGLYLVKSLVELHKGSISVESELNKGSSFTICLPYNFHHQLSETPHSPEFLNDSERNWDAIIEKNNPDLLLSENEHQNNTKAKTTYTIMIVEDDPDVRGYLVNEFRNEFHIVEAENGLVALEISKEKPLDLVLSDIMMPEMNGIEFCNAFKKDLATSHIPLILLTAKSSIENKIEGVEFGADDYITKPFNVKYLRTKILSLIHSREEMRKAFGKSFSINMPVVETQDIDDILITKVIEIIKENITNSNLNGEMIAEKLNISRIRLYRKLKALVDCSSNEFIRHVRLKYAKTLLDSHNFNISEVAYDSGFSSPAYFSTCFSNFYGMSPKEYIQQKQDPTSN